MAGKYECEGQINLFSFLKTEIRESPILLEKGQPVYLVNKADVIAAKVADNEKSWICGEDNRGYRLVLKDGGYSCTWNDRILGKEAFTDYESAKAKADEWLNTHSGIIFAEDIKSLNTVAYSYIRGIDGREMTAFYCDLGNDMYYIKEFMTFHHICKGKNADKAIKRFVQQQEFKHNKPKEVVGYVPSLKNMYKCTRQSDWDYAECGYSYATG